ncbi:MAG: cytochrome c oxidase assembly protein [Acidimicrobiales bacterium]
MPLKSPAVQTSVLVAHWQTSWTLLVALAVEVAVLVWYLMSVRRLARGGRRWPGQRTASFVVGLAVLAYLVEGGLAHYQRINFTAHVVQLVLIAYVVPPLLAVGAPLRLGLQTLRRRPSAVLAGALHSRVARALTQPLVACGVFIATLYLYFLTPLYTSSEAHPSFLVLVDLVFVLGCALFWWVVAGRDALPRTTGFGMRFVVLVVTVPFNAFLGLAVAGVSRPLYAAANTLADTHRGGDVLWGLSEVIVVAALGLLFVEWAREEERKAVNADRQFDAAMTAARAATAAAPAGESGFGSSGEDVGLSRAP